MPAISFRGHLATVTTTVLFACSAAVQAVEPADLILQGGRIHTPSGVSDALAVQGGVIVAIGDAAAVAPYRGPATRVEELGGATVIPGLHDLHVHPIAMGLTQTQCRFQQGSSPAQIIDGVRGCAAAHDKGTWIVGGQWEASGFNAKQPMHRRLLDRAAPDHPVSLVDISGHSLWVNSKALALAGIDAKTPDPAGGVIERDARGEPTGVLRESALGLVRRVIPPPTQAEVEQALRWAHDTMLSVGITSFTDAGVDDAGLRAYGALADRGELKQRVRGCMWAVRNGLVNTQTPPEEYIALRHRYDRGRFKADCVKLVLDGVPTDSHTGAMVEPYVDIHDHADPRARGILMIPAAQLRQAVIDYDRLGLTVKMHAAGDAAVRAGLDAIEAARAANGFSGTLHDVAHNTFAQRSDLQRARAIGATLEFSPYIWFPNPIIPDIVRVVGDERMQRWVPVKDALDAGALVVPGSDWYVVPSVDPWYAIETLVTRQKPGGGSEVLAPSQRITLAQALQLYTVNSARHMGNAGRTGSIERGFYADLVVLDRDPFGIPVTELHATRARMTIIAGEVVYRAP